MKLRNKIFIGVAAFFLVSVSALAITLSYESSCPPVPALAAGTTSMRAIMHRCYGSPGVALVLEQIAKPVPGDEQVLIKVHASSVNPAEWHKVTGKPYIMRLSTGLAAPDYLRVAYDIAGTVEAVGAKVTRFKPGDEVFGGAGGALAEYAVARENGNIVAKPSNMTFEEAAAIPIAGVTALEALRDYGRIARGQKVLINGASGGVGTYAVQIAKSFGAQVTAVCSTRNVELVRSLGADRVIDYTQENFTEGQEQYDLIVDNVGNHPFRDLRRVVKPRGTIVTVGGPKDDAFLGPLTRIAKQELFAPFTDMRLVFFIANIDPPDLEFLAGLVRAGKLKSVIDRRYPLEQAGAALEYIGSQRARGKVVVTLD